MRKKTRPVDHMCHMKSQIRNIYKKDASDINGHWAHRPDDINITVLERSFAGNSFIWGRITTSWIW